MMLCNECEQEIDGLYPICQRCADEHGKEVVRLREENANLTARVKKMEDTKQADIFHKVAYTAAKALREKIALEKENANLTAKVGQLREALQDIANHTDVDADECMSIAQRTLEQAE